MASKELAAGIILIGIGILFFLNNKNIAKGSYKFYQWLYTEERLTIMFRIAGIILVVGGLLLLVLN